MSILRVSISKKDIESARRWKITARKFLEIRVTEETGTQAKILYDRQMNGYCMSIGASTKVSLEGLTPFMKTWEHGGLVEPFILTWYDREYYE